jgi:ribosome-dependent ATPase
MIPPLLTAVAVVREKELGSIANLYATPLRPLEFLLGKQLPYVLVSLVAFGLLFLLAVLLFRVPFHGSGTALVAGALLYTIATTAIGLVISSFTRTQISALLVAVILTLLPAFLYSGFFTPISSLSGVAKAVALSFPAGAFLGISVGTFTKGLGMADLWSGLLVLAGFAVVLDGAALALLRDQER